MLFWFSIDISWKIKKKQWKKYFLYKQVEFDNDLFKKLIMIFLYYDIDYIDLEIKRKHYILFLKNTWKAMNILTIANDWQEYDFELYINMSLWNSQDKYNKKKRILNKNLVVRLEDSNHRKITKFKNEHWNTSLNEIINALIENNL